MHCLPPITISHGDIHIRKTDPVSLSRRVAIDLQNFISQKLKKLFERKFQGVF